MPPISFSLLQLAKELKAEFRGDGDCRVTAVATLESAKPGTISFLGNIRYLEYLKTTQASIVIITKESLEHCHTNALIVENPYFALATIAHKFEVLPIIEPGIHPSAIISDDCTIQPSVSIGPNVVIGEGVSLGERVVLEAGVVIGAHSSIAADTHIYPHVTVYHAVKIGERCIIHSGVVIGADGFGMVQHKDRWHKIPQLGGVHIGNDVEVGANTTIDRGAIEDTMIAEGVKLDNQIQVGHNVHIGAHTVIAGCVAIAGSTHIGKYCMIGGGASIAGHITLADHVTLTGETQVGASIEKAGVYSSGFPCQEKSVWFRNVFQFHKLTQLSQRVRALEKELGSREAGETE